VKQEGQDRVAFGFGKLYDLPRRQDAMLNTLAPGWTSNTAKLALRLAGAAGIAPSF